MYLEELEELLANVGGDTLAVGWVKPDDAPAPFSLRLASSR